MKKIISIALALLMVAVMLPVMAMAEGATKEVSTQEELTAAVANGGEVTLGANITASITIPKDKTVTLNLGAFTLTGDGDHTITNNGTLTVVGSGKVEKQKLHSQRKWQHSCSQLLCGSVAEDHRDHSLRSDYLPL